MNNKTIVSLVVFGLVFAAPVMAALVPTVCQGASAAGQCTLSSLKDLVANMINFLLGFAGLVCLLFLVIGGVRMLTSGGNPETVKNAKSTISNAFLGLAITLAAYLIINVVIIVLSGGSINGLADLLSFW